MADEVKFHIMLLPRDDYWGWVNSCRDYAVRYGVSLTPLPDNALRFNRPRQIITIVRAPAAYPAQGDIGQWFVAQEPEIPMDIIDVQTPDQLRQVLQSRIDSNQRFGGSQPQPAGSAQIDTRFRLLWPVDSPVKTQEFGVNPDIYRRFGLPAHEGIDFRAPLNSNIYVGADGEVYLVNDGRDGNAYGIHVRVRHDGGYRTIYAHLNRALVRTGQQVKAGEVIGLADSTGNSTGHHLHLTLKKDGATAAGETSYPGDIIDPTPFLVMPTDFQLRALPPGVWPHDHCLVGLHGRVGGPMGDADWQQVGAARVEALKLLSTSSPDDVDRARQINPDIFLIVGLLGALGARPAISAEFASLIETRMRLFYDRGVRYFEIHNEPNLTPEGSGTSWRDGHEFGEWFLEVMGFLRPRFPEAKLGWPGLSPGPTVAGMRMDQTMFLESAEHLVAQADWIGCHCHWEDESQMLSEIGGLSYRYYRQQWPDKLLLITEFSNTSSTVDISIKAGQYLKYYRHLNRVPGVGAAFAFAVSATAGYSAEVWRDEQGRSTPVAGVIGGRTF